MRILVVEDEIELADAIAAGLNEEGLRARVAYDGASAHSILTEDEFDAVVLDRDLPKLHGDELCRRMRAIGDLTPVLMLTASSMVHERVDGLNLGADDYLAKPFAFAELLARLRAIGRRAGTPLPPVLLRSGIQLDPGRRIAARDGRTLHLSRKEFALLEVLLNANGAACSVEKISRQLWDEQWPTEGRLRVTMSYLRRKLGDPDPITTHAGFGYQLR
jgi:DNA-binding response OmpR family regulator